MVKEITKDYYANDAGLQLKDWWKTTNKQGYTNFCIMNAVKYATRIGRKPDQESKDYEKYHDYINQAAELLEADPNQLSEAVMQELENFQKWTGGQP